MQAAVNQKIRINILRATGLLLAVIMVSTPALGVAHFSHEMIEFCGVLLLASVLGRFWSILLVELVDELKQAPGWSLFTPW